MAYICGSGGVVERRLWTERRQVTRDESSFVCVSLCFQLPPVEARVRERESTNQYRAVCVFIIKNPEKPF